MASEHTLAVDSQRRMTVRESWIVRWMSAAILFGLLGACAPGQRSGNLVRNPGGEEIGASGPVGWMASGDARAQQYGTDGYPTLFDEGPRERGSNFFYGGEADNSALTQLIDVSQYAAAIDTGRVSYELSAYLGGFTTQNDYAYVAIAFYNGMTDLGGRARVGPVTVLDRQGVTSLLERSITGAVPANTRSIVIGVAFQRTEGIANDGYVDNVSVTLGGI